MKFFLLEFLNLMSCKNRNGVMLANIFFMIFFQFFKIRVECPFNSSQTITSYNPTSFHNTLMLSPRLNG